MSGLEGHSSREKGMQQIKDSLPWKVTDISLRPYDGMWSMNPSIHFDGELWRCVLRCCDYAMPDGVSIRSKSARPVGQQTKNAMVILDPQSWRPVQVFKMHEKDGLPREACAHVGFEDMRIFKTDEGGLQGIAAALHLKRDRRAAEGMTQHQPPEQVLLSFDKHYDIVCAQPIRGDGWSGTPQKNWVPFDHCVEPRFLYSIDKGRMFNDQGALRSEEAHVKPSRFRSSKVPVGSPLPQAALAIVQEEPSLQALETPSGRGRPDRRRVRGGDVRIIRGGRLKLDAVSGRTAPRSATRPVAGRGTGDGTRMLGSGRTRLPTYAGLRGGTQLVQVGANSWLGIGHEMTFVGNKKLYWHTWYLVNSKGSLLATSMPMKLASNGIEFAAGMAIDGDRVVVSFGVDDMECRLGETSLGAVLEALRPFKC